MKRITILLAATALLLLATSCGEESGTGTLPDLPADKTPLAMGQVHIAAQTRATAEEFFEVGGDALGIFIDGVETSLSQWYDTGFGELDPPIYLEDVWKPTDGVTKELRADFSVGRLFTNQTNTDRLHAADYLTGPLTVDAPNKTLNCDAMTRQHTQLILQITKGDGWVDDADFMRHFVANPDVHNPDYSYYIHTTSNTKVYPLATTDDPLTTLTLTCILPPGEVVTTAGATILTLTVPDTGGTAKRTLRLETAITAEAGKSITVSATYHKLGTFSGINATLAEWVDVEYDKELPGWNPEELARREAEKQRFLAWATGAGEDFTLACDIDLSDVTDYEPIVDFAYTFDGGGHTISGLKIDKPTNNSIGLFGTIAAGGTVRNLAVYGEITGKLNVGGIAGYNNGTIAGCTFSGTVTGTEMCIGGITGFNNDGLIIGCRVTQSTIAGPNLVGGIVGHSISSATGIIACLADGITLNGTDTGFVLLGGIVGQNEAPLVACVAAPKEITSAGSTTYAGGITGINTTAPNATATTCYWQTGSGYSKAIAGDYHPTPQEANCTPFAPGTFPATTAVDALNAAIEAWNMAAEADGQCGYRWKATTGNTVGAGLVSAP